MSTEYIPNAVCPVCGAADKVVRLTRPEIVHVRDIDVRVNRVLRKCEVCNAEFENSRDYDWKRDAYAAYRKEKNYHTPDQVKSWRARFGLTQAEVSQLLGWGEATLGRYENGALPTDAQHRQLSALMRPAGLAQALEESPGAIPEQKHLEIMDKLRPALARLRALQTLMSLAGSFPPDELTGRRFFDVWRTSALVSILARGGEFKTKLNKLLFYSDFSAFRLLGASISGLRYARIPLGPVPKDYENIYASLCTLDVVAFEPKEIQGYYGELIHEASPTPTDVLTSAEVKIAELVKSHFSGWSAKRTVSYSHRERAWKEVSPCGLIPYTFADSLLLRIDLPHDVRIKVYARSD